MPREDSIWSIQTPWGGARFHRYGQHPAGAELRAQRDRLIAAVDRAPTRAGMEMLAWVESQLSAIELGELRAKVEAAERLNDA